MIINTDVSLTIKFNTTIQTVLSTMSTITGMVPQYLIIYCPYFSLHLNILNIYHFNYVEVNENRESLASFTSRGISKLVFLISVPVDEEIVPIANIDSQQIRCITLPQNAFIVNINLMITFVCISIQTLARASHRHYLTSTYILVR